MLSADSVTMYIAYRRVEHRPDEEWGRLGFLDRPNDRDEPSVRPLAHVLIACLAGIGVSRL